MIISSALQVSVWVDRFDFERAAEYQQIALAALTKAKIFLLVLNKTYIEDLNSRNELLLAIEHCKFIIPLCSPEWDPLFTGSDWWKTAQDVDDRSDKLKVGISSKP